MIQSFNPCDECDYSFTKQNQESQMCSICEFKNLLTGKKVDNKFKIVVMYKCRWCEKIFRSTRHKCMYNPENKNCFSCKYCTGFDDFKGQYGEYGRCELEPYKEFICSLEETVDTGYTDFYELNNKKWIGNCPHWEMRMDMRERKATQKCFNWNDKEQFYKGIRIRLIPYALKYYSNKKAKRFELGKRKYGQSIWIPNAYLEDDGTLKPNINIDFIMNQAYQQKKFQYAHIDIKNIHR